MGRPAARPLSRASRRILPADPLRQGWHRPLGSSLALRAARRWSSGWTRFAPSWTLPARSAPCSSGRSAAVRCQACSRPPSPSARLASSSTGRSAASSLTPGCWPGLLPTQEAALERVEREWGTEGVERVVLGAQPRQRRGDEAGVSPLRPLRSKPRVGARVMQMGYAIDWEEFLPTIHVPTLVLHRIGRSRRPGAPGSQARRAHSGSEVRRASGQRPPDVGR